MRIRTIIGALTSSVVLVAGLSGGLALAAPPPSKVFVSTKNCSDLGPGSSKVPFCTIQAGVNAVASGGTVSISNGTYAEAVTVPAGKNGVTLQGNGKNTVIKAPDSFTNGGTIVTVYAQNVTMDDLSVSGPFNISDCNGQAYGIYMENGASLNLRDASVVSIEAADAGLRGCQAGAGIRVGQQSASIAASATITDVSLSDYAKGGVVVDGTGSHATITDTRATGFGPTTIVAQNGFQISRGATATLKDDTATNNSYTPQTYTAAGFLFYQSGEVTVTASTANNNDVGFDVDAQNSTFSKNTANNNVFNGIYAEMTASGDTFTQNTARGTSGAQAPYSSYDIEDDSNGTGSLHTANTYSKNTCKTSSPAELCRL